MSPTALLAAIRARGATLALAPGPEGPRLEFDGPADLMTPRVRALLAEHKAELIALLLAEVDRATAEARASIPPPPWPDDWQVRWADRLDALADAGLPWPECVWGALAVGTGRARGPPLRGPTPDRQQHPGDTAPPRKRGRIKPEGATTQADRLPSESSRENPPKPSPRRCTVGRPLVDRPRLRQRAPAPSVAGPLSILQMPSCSWVGRPALPDRHDRASPRPLLIGSAGRRKLFRRARPRSGRVQP